MNNTGLLTGNTAKLRDLLRFGINPPEVDGVINTATIYYKEKLLRLLKSIFEFDNLPDEWDKAYFRDHLFREGHIGIFDTTLGVIPLRCSFQGINVWDKPTHLYTSNHILGNITAEIGTRGEYICFFDNYMATFDELLTRYATMLANCECSVNVSLINSRVAHVFRGRNKAQAETLKHVYDEVTKGKPAVFVNDEMYDKDTVMELNNVKNTYIANEVIETRQAIMGQFLTEIGIDNVNFEKSERLTNVEIQSNNAEINGNTIEWLENLETCVDRVNALFGLDIVVKQRFEAVSEALPQIPAEDEEGEDEE